MEKIIVVVFKGKGVGEPYKFSIKLFNSFQEANNFIANVTNLSSNYWTVARLANEGEDIEIYCRK